MVDIGTDLGAAWTGEALLIQEGGRQTIRVSLHHEQEMVDLVGPDGATERIPGAFLWKMTAEVRFPPRRDRGTVRLPDGTGVEVDVVGWTLESGDHYANVDMDVTHPTLESDWDLILQRLRELES